MITFNDGRSTASITEFDHKCGVLPSEKLVMLRRRGFADGFETQAAASGYRGYNAHGGLTAAGLGFSATHFITHGWLINADVAVNRLLGSASDSPITQSSFQGIVELTTAYQW